MIEISDRGLACLWEVVRGPGGLPGRPGEAWTERRRLAWLFGADLVTELVGAGWLSDWPELAAVLKAHGVLQYSIHLHADTLQLFGYVEVEDELRWDEISSTAVCQRWWAHMAELMETHDDHRPKAIVLKEVFSLDSKT
jgi:L-rhamnose mutarotase